MRRKGKLGFWGVAVATAAGLGGELFVRIPGLGYLAMLDLLAYAIGIPILVMHWSHMGKSMRHSLMWGFAWTLAAVLANLFHFYDLRLTCKCVTIVASSWTLMAVGYMLMKDRPVAFLWFIVGAGLGGWISLYHFRNGALEGFATGGDMGGEGYGLDLLMEKQIVPLVAKGILIGCIMPVFLAIKKLPIFMALVVTTFAGFYVLFHGGSRSSFGIFCAAAGAGFLASYGGAFFRRLAKSRLVMGVTIFVAFSIVFGGYKYMASSGMMGEGEAQKLENEFGEEGKGAINGRASFDKAFMVAFKTYGIGCGTYLQCHSSMANALCCEGFIGFAFWIYFYWQVFWYVCKRGPYGGRYTSFIFVMILTACWNAFGSPFGCRYQYFVLMAFIALCKDNPYYGVGTLFDEKMVWRRGLPWRSF